MATTKISLAAYRKELEKYDEQREKVIETSRCVLRDAKKLIYAIERNDDTTQTRKDLTATFQKAKAAATSSELASEGSYSEACQEYAESIILHDIMSNKSPSTANDLGISTDDYLLGMCDATGELGRIAVACAIQGDKKKLEYIHSITEQIYKEFLEFNLRNSPLRKKSDSIKWNLAKITDILYDFKLKGKTNDN